MKNQKSFISIMIVLVSIWGCKDEEYFYKAGTQAITEPVPSVETPIPAVEAPKENEDKNPEKEPEIVEEKDPNPPVVGKKDDGIGDVFIPKDRNCVPGNNLAIYLDLNDDGKLTEEDKLLDDITAYSGELDAVKNYNYYSASAHPIVGPIPTGFQSHVFFYQQKNEAGELLDLALTFYHNVDETSGSNYSGSSKNTVKWDFIVLGNHRDETQKQIDKVLFVDDPNHNLDSFEKLGEDLDYDFGEFNGAKGKGNFYKSDLTYFKNTDGGILGPFRGESFLIYVKSKINGDNLSASFYSADGKVLSLSSEDQIKSFFIKFRKFETCEN